MIKKKELKTAKQLLRLSEDELVDYLSRCSPKQQVDAIDSIMIYVFTHLAVNYGAKLRSYNKP